MPKIIKIVEKSSASLIDCDNTLLEILYHLEYLEYNVENYNFKSNYTIFLLKNDNSHYILRLSNKTNTIQLFIKILKTNNLIYSENSIFVDIQLSEIFNTNIYTNK